MAIDIHERIRAIEAVDTVQGVTEIAPDRIQRSAPNWSDSVRAGMSYFRLPDARMPAGRIALLQNGSNAMERVMYRDHLLLRQYGGYRGGSHPADWQLTDPYLGIIERGGGREFDAEQILDVFWHLRPGRDAPKSHRLLWAEIDALIATGVPEEDAILTVLPQLAGRDLTPAVCEGCPGRQFRDAASVRGHRSVMHKDDVQTLGTRDAIAMALTSGGNADLLAQLVEQNRMLMEMLTNQNGTSGRRRKASPTDDDTE